MNLWGWEATSPWSREERPATAKPGRQAGISRVGRWRMMPPGLGRQGEARGQGPAGEASQDQEAGKDSPVSGCQPVSAEG